MFQNESRLLMAAEGYVAAAVTLFLIGFLGFFLNLLVIVLMWKDKKLWTPLNTVLFNLVCSDFSVSVLGNPWTLASAVNQRWAFGETLCQMYGFFMALLGITSITTLAVLSFERYVMVSQPFRNVKLTHEVALISILGIWIYSLSITTPPLFGWGDYRTEAANISCSINWEDQTYNTMTYIVFLFVFGLVVPVAVIGFSYTNIILTMKESRLQSGRVPKLEGRISMMILVMIIAFLVAWTPYAAMALIIQFGDAQLVTPALGVIPALMAKSSICYNPIIYAGMNTQFRQSWRRVFSSAKNNERQSTRSFATNLTEVATKKSFGGAELLKSEARRTTTFLTDCEDAVSEVLSEQETIYLESKSVHHEELLTTMKNWCEDDSVL